MTFFIAGIYAKPMFLFRMQSEGEPEHKEVYSYLKNFYGDLLWSQGAIGPHSLFKILFFGPSSRKRDLLA